MMHRYEDIMNKKHNTKTVSMQVPGQVRMRYEVHSSLSVRDSVVATRANEYDII